MTARVVLACDGEWPLGVRCRQAQPVGEVLTGSQARHEARLQGWSAPLIGGLIADLCPACTRRRLEGRTR